ncbi:hypothetical protein GM418_02290 [Maribellus comscasis]|uniref:Four helix bundle protein n=1 Tax=Maribellus comscasis TaxID=2681766 RepID=A0A6I6JRB2_9BACT|nr:hypothetical protein GM418_02290 [Maribellus comscasis]
MSFVKEFTELETYKLARSISFEIFQLTKIFPSEEKFYSLNKQCKLLSKKINSMILKANQFCNLNKS